MTRPDQETGALYVVALPVGNTEDITLRALKVLREASIIAAEDTRTFSALAHELHIVPKRLLSYHDHNETNSAHGLLELLIQGNTVALVSDAGTPGIADPGYKIINLCNQSGIPVIPVPGVSSLTAALSVCPIGGSQHIFLGFAPTKPSERQLLLRQMIGREIRSVIFETPHRILSHLNEAKIILGDIELFIAREITKKYEEIGIRPLNEWIQKFSIYPPRGEFVLVYPPIPKQKNTTDIESEIEKLINEGRSTKQVLTILLSQSGLTRSDLYDLIQTIKQKSKTDKT